MTTLQDVPNEFFSRFPDADRFLVGYPRSGTRWVQIFLNDVYLSEIGESQDDFYDFRLQLELEGPRCTTEWTNHLVVDLHALCTWERFARPARGFPVVIRMHSWEALRDRSGVRIVGLVREPSAMLRSYYHYAVSHGYLRRPLAQARAFAKARLEEWYDFNEKLFERWKNEPELVLPVAYQEGDPVPYPILRRIHEHLALPGGEPALTSAHDRLRAFVAGINERPEFPYARGGSRSGGDFWLWRMLPRGLRAEARALHSSVVDQISDHGAEVLGINTSGRG